MESAQNKRSTGLIVGGAIVGLVASLAARHRRRRDLGGPDAARRNRLRLGQRAPLRSPRPGRSRPDGVAIGSEVPDWLVGKVRLQASSSKPVFVGIARKADVDAYLAGVSYARATKLDLDPFKVTYVAHRGKAAPAGPPTSPSGPPRRPARASRR